MNGELSFAMLGMIAGGMLSPTSFVAPYPVAVSS